MAAAAADDGAAPVFVEWREQFVSQERGRRVVHYYLDDASGGSHLAVVGTEKSIRHMLYIAEEGFCEAYAPGLGRAGGSGLKWRAKREVESWLDSFVPKRIGSCGSYSKSPQNETAHILDAQDHPGRTLRRQNSDIVWSGVSWTCGKQLRHFNAFHRNGITISIHSFVLVLSEEENRYLAYLEDMYEDKKRQKKVKVRWFHQNQEVFCPIPPPAPHPKEVFITSFFQVISAECVDGLATVLTPEHYDKCSAALPPASSAGTNLCFRQYSKNRFKSFDLTSLAGYFDQPVLSCLDICNAPGEDVLENTAKHLRHKRIKLAKGHQRSVSTEFVIKMSAHANYTSTDNEPSRRPRCVKFIGPRHRLVPPYKMDEKIELLCQDSGLRGCWFRCTILKLAQERLKVQYCDVQNEDGSGNLKEWIPAFKPAAPDILGMRCSGRLTVRPCPSRNHLPEVDDYQIGTPVDAWWNDGWWEGVVTELDSSGDDSLKIYFPGEAESRTCQRKDTRISKDWDGNQWVDIKVKPDILSAISMYTQQRTKLSAASSDFVKGVESGSSAMSDRQVLDSKVVAVEQGRKAVASLSSGTGELPRFMIPQKRCRGGSVDADCYEGGSGNGSYS